MNHVSSFFGIAILLYLGYIAIAPTPAETLDRTCAPAFQWPKKFLAAGARIFSPSAEVHINQSFDAGFARCRAWGWGVLYEDEYRRLTQKAAKESK